jgi:hypothetical protein
VSAPREFTSLFLACGLGAGARGFQKRKAVSVPTRRGSARSAASTIDPASCRDFELLTGSPALQADLHTLTPAELRALRGPAAP